MSEFQARTRLRGEIRYYRATWIADYFKFHQHGVRFEEGPHRGEIYHKKDCAIAMSDKYLLGIK